MSLQLLPGIIWAVDDQAWDMVRPWYKELYSKIQRFLKVAKSADEVRSAVDEFQQARFDQVLMDCGLSLRPHNFGRRIALVLVGYGMGRQAFQGWENVENELAKLSQNAYLDSYRVLLARSELHGEEDRVIRLAGLRETPWLITDRTTGNYHLVEEDVLFYLGRLLDALLLTEKDGVTAGAHVINKFYKAPGGAGSVRLAGFSHLELQGLVKEIADKLAGAVLGQAYVKEPELTRTRPFEKQWSDKLNQFLRGELRPYQVTDFLFGRDGMGGWTATDIFKEGCGILEKATMRIKQEALGEVVEKEESPGFLKRLFGRVSTKAPAAPDRENIDNFEKNLDMILNIISPLREQAREASRQTPQVPPAYLGAWQKELDAQLIEVLAKSSPHADIMRKLSAKVESDVSHNFLEALHHWGLEDHVLQELSEALENGSLLRFSASLRGGIMPVGESLITSLSIGDIINHGGQQIACANLRMWPGRPPLLIAASQAINLGLIKGLAADQRDDHV